MGRRRGEPRRPDAGHGSARERAEFRESQRLTDVLRRLQLTSAGVMLVGVAAGWIVCAGEIEVPWLTVAGGGVFLLGIALFLIARPLARWWVNR